MEQQRSKEWFEKRKGRVTGSSVGAILGFDPYRNESDVMRQMVREYHGAEREFTGNAATQWGVANESNALFELSCEIGDIRETGFHTYEDWLGASPDGFYANGVVEVKCPFSRMNCGEFKTLDEQPHYYAQMQIEMLVTGTGICAFFQWAPHASKLEYVHFNQEWIDENLPKLRDFYERFLLEIDNPVHLMDKVTEINAPDLAEDYKLAKIAYDEAESNLKSAKEALIKAVGASKKAVIGSLAVSLVQKEGAISYANAVKKLCPDADLEPFRGKPSEYWMIRDV